MVRPPRSTSIGRATTGLWAPTIFRSVFERQGGDNLGLKDRLAVPGQKLAIACQQALLESLQWLLSRINGFFFGLTAHCKQAIGNHFPTDDQITIDTVYLLGLRGELHDRNSRRSHAWARFHS